MVKKKTRQKLVPVEPVEEVAEAPTIKPKIKLNLKKLQTRPIREHRPKDLKTGLRLSQRNRNTASPTGMCKAVISVANYIVIYRGRESHLLGVKWYVSGVPGGTNAIRSMRKVLGIKPSSTPNFQCILHEGTERDLGDEGWASTAYGTVQEIIEVEDGEEDEIEAQFSMTVDEELATA